MKNFLKLLKELALDFLFPKICINCQREGFYLCEDCFFLIDIFDRQYCPFCQQPNVVPDGKTCSSCRRSKKLNGVFCATSYEDIIVKRLIHRFKYEPYIKELSGPLSNLIIAHLQKTNKLKEVREFLLVPVPLHKSKLKYRGFNQAEEIAKNLSEKLDLLMRNDILRKIKRTESQVNLPKEERERNLRDVFVCQNQKAVRNKKILLVDDVLTTGSTLEECARLLKQAGAKEVWGVVVARG